LFIAGMPARTHASQGEQRTLALALRLGAHRLVTDKAAHYKFPPVAKHESVDHSKFEWVRGDVHTKTLQEWKADGRIRYLGITHYTASAHAQVARQLEKTKYDFLQINYSLAEREAENSVLPKAKDLGVAVIINRPFAEGALFRKVKGKPLPPWAAEIGVQSWAQYFLKWIVAHPAVTCAIPGTGKPEHMRDNLAAGMGALPDEAMRKKMQEHFNSL
jgi:aryl-alcohol dehydrogenase-like predicted oxidoreductase